MPHGQETLRVCARLPATAKENVYSTVVRDKVSRLSTAAIEDAFPVAAWEEDAVFPVAAKEVALTVAALEVNATLHVTVKEDALLATALEEVAAPLTCANLGWHSTAPVRSMRRQFALRVMRGRRDTSWAM